MVLSLVLWVFQCIIFLCYGRAFLHFISPLISSSRRSKSSFFLHFLAGLATVTTLASVLSIFMPLNAQALGIISLGAIIILCVEWKRDRFKSLLQTFKAPAGSKLWMVACIVLLLIVLEVSTRTPANSDTGIYHAQAIRWIETYPAVPGLGNLHDRFAYNSSWLVVNALFSFAFAGGQSFHTLPGLLMAVFVLCAMQGIAHIFSRESRLSDWFVACLLPLLFYKLLAESSSPGTDLPAILLVWFILAEWMKEIETPGSDPYRPLVLVFLSAFAITIKLAVLPIFLVSLFFIIKQLLHHANRSAIIMMLLMILVVLPWMARNVILSGYLVYPEPALDIFQVDWKIPEEEVVSATITIQSWARIPRMDASIVYKMPFSTWFLIWFVNLSRFYQAILWVILFSPLILLLGAIVNRVRHVSLDFPGKVLPVYGLLYIALIYWLFSAPSIRFGVGFIMAAFVCTFFPLFMALQKLQQPWITRLAAVFLLLVCVFLYGVLYRGNEMRSLPERLVIPADYENLSTSPCRLKNVTVFCADWYSVCGYEAFPCIPQANPDVALRGNGLRDGFRMESPGD
ncbi:MAG: hypothetical protein ABFD58_07685 [Anaerolineaceae bacterium]